jgi:hypothetical protein
LRRSQQALHGYLAHARVVAAQLERDAERTNAVELTAHAERLAKENAQLAKQGGYAKALRPERSAFPVRPPLSFGNNGLPLRWHGDSPLRRLVSVLDGEEALARSGTELLLLAGLALLVLSYLRRGLALLRALWPETLIAVVGFGIWLDGVSLVAIAILGGAVMLRALWLGLLLQRLLTAPHTAAAANGANGPSTPAPASS